jgi:hypothetical protein
MHHHRSKRAHGAGDWKPATFSTFHKHPFRFGPKTSLSCWASNRRAARCIRTSPTSRIWSTTGAAELKQLQAIMRQYSQDVTRFLTRFLSPYQGRWQLDYASFRPQEEQGRDLPLRRRNDLLHTDAFPTRPTRGARILRFFNNIHPSRTRDWVVSDPFPVLAPRYAPQQIALPSAGGSAGRALRSLANAAGLGYAVPSLKRSPYDDFMMRFHNFLKENASFQAECRKEYLQFPAGSSWMVYTDMVPHAVLSGQYALEQTFLVEHQAMVSPESSPLSVLEAMTHSALV